MKNLVVTLDINYPKEITNLTFPYMESYAENINADFKIITERKYQELPIPLEKFQLYDVCEGYERTTFLDADCLINPKSKDFSSIVEDDIVIVPEYLDILNSSDPQFQTKNIMGKYNLNTHCSFCFLSFHRSQKNVVKPWIDPLKFKNYVNTTEAMKKNNKPPEWHLDEFFLTLNIVRYGLSTISVVQDMSNSIIAHNGNYLTVKEKIKNLKNNIFCMENFTNTQLTYG